MLKNNRYCQFHTPAISFQIKMLWMKIKIQLCRLNAVIRIRFAWTPIRIERFSCVCCENHSKCESKTRESPIERHNLSNGCRGARERLPLTLMQLRTKQCIIWQLMFISWVDRSLICLWIRKSCENTVAGSEKINQIGFNHFCFFSFRLHLEI